MRQWGHEGGFSLNADVTVAAWDRAGSAVGLPSPQTPARWADRSLTYTLEFLDRLAVLIPPPRKHRHRYHGFLTPNAALRQAVTAYAGLPIGAEAALKRTSPGAAGLIGSRC